MSAEVTAKVKLDAAEFRAGIVSAQTGFTRFKNNAMTEGRAVAKAFAPAAKVLAGMGVAAGVAAAATGVAFGSMVKDGLALNSSIEQATATFTAFTKDAALAKQIVMDLRTEADVTPFDTGEMITAGKALISSAKGSREELMKLVKTAEVLAALNPAQGLEGAAFSIREAMGGDYVSLQSRFDISRSVIKELKAQGLEGMELINAALKQMGAGPELVMQMASTWEGLSSTAGSFFDNMKQASTAPLFDVIKGELVDFVQYISGDAKMGVDEFTKAFGENIADSAKDLFGTIKSIDWAEMGQDAKAFSDFLGTAAVNAAALVSSMSEKAGDIKNLDNKAGAFNNSVMGKSENLAANVYDLFGADEMAAKAREKAAGFAANETGYRDKVAAHDAKTTARYPADSDRANPMNQTAISTNAVVDNWLRAHGKTAMDATKDKKLQADMVAKFGAGALQGGGMSNEDIHATQAANRANTGRAGQESTINFTLNERNPGHEVMGI